MKAEQNDGDERVPKYRTYIGCYKIGTRTFLEEFNLENYHKNFN